MELTLNNVAPDDVLNVLRDTTPFGNVPEELLRKVAALGRRARYAAGERIYNAGGGADDIYVVLSGRVEHIFASEVGAREPLKRMGRAGVFGWAGLLLGQTKRLATVTALEPTELIRIDTEALVKLLEEEPAQATAVMERFASMIVREFTVPELLAQVRRLSGEPQPQEMSSLGLTLYRLGQWARSPRPYLMLIGFALFLGFWYLSVEVWKLPRFREMPGITAVLKEWFSPNPTYGLSFYTAEYYEHIGMSVWRVAQAFFLATALGVPVGLLLGWSRKFKEYVFPVFELLRPIPILAWVPLAIVMFIATESAVVFLAFLASFFATALNTMLGVESIDESYVRAANCLGASRWQVFRHVIVPGAMPFIFTGLQISIGVSWFSLVAAEMVSGQYGLGYVINTSYMMVRYPTIVIGMITLGFVGYTTSAMVRIAGDYLMEWRVRELALADR
ncbi:MAG TPA: ABC transporter permease subunit [Burkholderiales bacterium]|jgi:ABC-type nitrate/sulfonate/bicarbonate transport system permease component|nr:ABC transporter permease subunit [Burkholderiales bacterium]